MFIGYTYMYLQKMYHVDVHLSFNHKSSQHLCFSSAFIITTWHIVYPCNTCINLTPRPEDGILFISQNLWGAYLMEVHVYFNANWNRTRLSVNQLGLCLTPSSIISWHGVRLAFIPLSILNQSSMFFTCSLSWLAWSFFLDYIYICIKLSDVIGNYFV